MEPGFFKQLLTSKTKVTLEEAIFRSEKAFKPSNLQEHQDFWEQEILKEHPHKQNLMKWISGVTLEEFLNSFTDSEFQGSLIHITLLQGNFLITFVLSLRLLWISRLRSGYRMGDWRNGTK